MATIVVCEDEPAIQKLFHLIFRATPHTLYLAIDGAAGLALIDAIRPDIIFSDLSMPVLDGLQLCDALKARPDLAHIPFIMITASVQRAQLEDAYRRGVADYLTKPFNAADLRALVDRLGDEGLRTED